MTPHRLLKLLFDDVLVGMIFGYIKLDSHREKAGNNEKTHLFLSMPLISGCHELSDHDIYCEV